MTPTELKAWFPLLSALQAMTAEQIQPYLTRCTPYFDVARWGDFYSEGVANLAVHFITMDNTTATAGIAAVVDGAYVSKTVGPVSASKSGEIVGEQVHDPFLRTYYGQEYCRLRDLVGLGGAVAL